MSKPPYRVSEPGKFLNLQPYEVVAVDESGLISPMGFDGSSYFVVFVCVRALYHDTFTMATKDEYPMVLELFLNKVKKRGFKVRAMHLGGSCSWWCQLSR